MIQKLSHFYYGWVVVAVSFLTLFFALGIRYSFSVYYIAILAEYGWGRAETAGAFSLAMIIHALFAPITGTFVDRLGPRKLFPLGATFLFFGLLAAGQISTKWHLYIFFGVVVAIGINTLSYAPHMSIIPRWFIKKRGLASGVVASGIGLGALVMVPFNELLIDTMGWRSAFLVLAGIILCILIPMTALFHRQSPNEIGQTPDCRAPEIGTSAARQEERDIRCPDGRTFWTVGATLREKAFWCIVLAVMCDGFIINMLLVHQAVYIVDVGFSKRLAASLVGLVGLFGSVGGLLCGFLSDHVGRKAGYTLGSLFSLIGIVFLMLTKNAVSVWMLFVFVIFFGLGNGGKMPMIATLTGDLFPGNALGRLMAIHAIGFGLGGAAGAYAGGYFHDLLGTYFVPFLLLIATIIIAALAIWMAAPASESSTNLPSNRNA